MFQQFQTGQRHKSVVSKNKIKKNNKEINDFTHLSHAKIILIEVTIYFLLIQLIFRRSLDHNFSYFVACQSVSRTYFCGNYNCVFRRRPITVLKDLNEI